jgi:hypothetical protein
MMWCSRTFMPEGLLVMRSRQGCIIEENTDKDAMPAEVCYYFLRNCYFL